MNATDKVQRLKLMGPTDLDIIRRRRRKTLDNIALQTGLGRCLVWRVLTGKCFDLRRIVPVVKALGVSLRRLDLEEFLGEKSQADHCDVQNLQNPFQAPRDQAGSPACPRGRCLLAEKKETVAANEATSEV